MTQYYFEDFEPGQVFSGSARARLDKETIVAFASTYDAQPFHVDEEAGRSPSADEVVQLSVTTMLVPRRRGDGLTGTPFKWRLRACSAPAAARGGGRLPS